MFGKFCLIIAAELTYDYLLQILTLIYLIKFNRALALIRINEIQTIIRSLNAEVRFAISYKNILIFNYTKN